MEIAIDPQTIFFVALCYGIYKMSNRVWRHINLMFVERVMFKYVDRSIDLVKFFMNDNRMDKENAFYGDILRGFKHFAENVIDKIPEIGRHVNLSQETINEIVNAINRNQNPIPNNAAEEAEVLAADED